jgi:hypothetical protein
MPPVSSGNPIDSLSLKFDDCEGLPPPSKMSLAILKLALDDCGSTIAGQAQHKSSTGQIPRRINRDMNMMFSDILMAKPFGAKLLKFQKLFSTRH